MEYDKNHFQKLSDKKVLHKVKKHWVVLSLSLLAMLGTGAVKATGAHASTLIPNRSQSKQSSSNGALDRQFQKTSQTPQSHQNSIHNRQPNSVNINQQAEALHQRILMNATTLNRSKSVNQSKNNLVNNSGLGNSQVNRRESVTAPAPDVKLGNSEDAEVNNGFIPPFNSSHIVSSGNILNFGGNTAKWALDNQGMLLIHDGTFNGVDRGPAGSAGLQSDIPGCNINSVKYITFKNTTLTGHLDMGSIPNVQVIDLSGINKSTLGYTDLRCSFWLDPNLETINFGHNLNTGNVSGDTGSFFSGDSKLKNLVGFSDLDLHSITDANDWFMNDSSLSDLDLSNFNTAAARNNHNPGAGSDGLSNLIAGCTGLRHIKLGPNSVLTPQAINGKSTESYALEPNGNGDIFQLADGQPHGPAQGEPTNGWTLLQGIKSYGKWNTSTYVFTNNGDLYLIGGQINQDRTRTSGINGYPNMSSSDWNSVKHIYTSHVSAGYSLNNTFGWLPNLQTFDGSGMDVSNVHDMSGVFDSDPNLQSLAGLHGWVDHNLNYMNGAFENDSSLQNLQGLSDWDVSHVSNNTSMENVFRGDTNLTSTLGLINPLNMNGGWYITKGQASIFNMFCSDTNLDEIEITPGFNFSNYGVRGAPEIPGTWVNYNNPGQKVDINRETTPGLYFNVQNCVQATINYQFGNKTVRQYQGLVPKEFSADDAPGLPGGYAITPQDTTVYQMAPNSTRNIQVDKAGEWGTADWYLNSQGHLLVADGQTSFVPGGLSGFINNGKGITGPLNPNDIISISTSDLYPPANNQNTANNPSQSSGYYWSAAYNTWSNLPNVRDIDLRGVHYENCNDLTDMFYGDNKLSDLNMSNVDDTKAIHNQIIGGSQSWGNKGNGINGIFTGVLPKRIELGAKTLLTGNVDLNNQSNRVIFGSLVNDPGNLTVLDDCHPHPGSWNVMYGDIGKWGSATIGYDTNTNSLYIANGTITDNCNDAYLANSNFNIWSNVKHINTYNVQFPNSSSWLFNSKSNLESIDLSGVTNSGHILDMSGMLDDDNNLRSVNFGSDFNTSNVDDFNYTFISDRNLGTLDLSHFDTRKAAQNNNGSLNSGNGLGSMLSSSDTGSKPTQTSVPNHILILGNNTILGANNQGQTNIPTSDYYINSNGDILSNNDPRYQRIADGKAHPGVWYANDGRANVTFKYGKTELSTQNIPLFNHQAYSSEFKLSQNNVNYELDPRLSQTISMNNGVHYNVQLDQTGHWGTATWDLTPNSDVDSDQATRKYGKGNLFIHNGTLFQPSNTSYSDLYDELGINQSSASNVYSISTRSDVVPNHSYRLFDDADNHFNNLVKVDASGLDTSNTSNFGAMFEGLTHVQQITGLNNLQNNKSTSDAWMFQDDPSLKSLDISAFDTRSKSIYHFLDCGGSGSSLHEITLGPNTILDDSANMGNGPWGYEASDPKNVQNLEDGKSHPGTWIIPASVTLHYHDIYGDIDGMKNPADHTVNVTSPNYHLKSSDVPNGYALVNGDKSSPNYGKIIQPGAVPFASAGPYDVTVAPVWHGLVYKYNQSNRSVEFTNGVMSGYSNFNGNLKHYIINTKFSANAPYQIANAVSIKFDDGIDFRNVKNLNWLFGGGQFSNLKEVDFGHIMNTDHLVDMVSSFEGMSKLVHLDLSGLDTSHVKDFTSMIDINPQLQYLNLGGYFSTAGVDHQNAFYGDGEDYLIGETNPNTLILSPHAVLNSNGPGAFDFNNNNTLNWLSDNYPNDSNTTLYNLADNRPHPGTWTRDAEVVDYDYNGQNKGKYRVNQSRGSSATVNGTNLQPGWHITNNHPDSFIVNGGEFKEGVSPNVDTKDYVQYHYGNTLEGSSPYISGNDIASGINGTFTISSKYAPGLPFGWHVDHGDGAGSNGLTFHHQNSSHQVYIEPNTYSEKVDYRVQNSDSYAKKNQILASDTTTLNDSRATAAGNNSLTIDGSNHPNLPKGYYLVSSYNFSHPAGQNYSDQALIAPNSVNQHINYQWYNRSVGSTNINGDYDNTGTINGTGLDAGWHVNDSATFNDTDGQGRFTFNGGTTNVGVLPNQETIPVVLYSGNQSNVIDRFSLFGSNSDRLNLMDHVPHGFSVNSSAARTALQNYVVGEGMNSGGVTGGGLSTQNPSNGTGSVNSVYVPVSPNVTLTVHVFYENSNGQLTSSDDRQVSVFAQPGGAVFYPGELSPDNSHSSYVLDTERTLPSDQARFDGQNVSWVNGEPTVYFKDVEAAVKAVFINQAGQQVGQPVFYSGVAGNPVHMISDNHIASASPDYSLTTSKYSVAPGQSQYQNFVLQPGEHTVYIHLQGNSDPNAKVNVVCLLRQPDGSYHRSDKSVPLSNYAYGDSDWLTPSDVHVQGYSPLPLDHSQDVKITPNILNGQKIVFYYEKTPTGDGTLLVHYINPDGWVLKSSEITRPVGSPVTLPNDAPLPEGYDLSSGNQTYTITDTPQETSVPVTGKQVNGLVLKLHRFTQDPDGQNRVVKTYQIHLSGQVGDSFHISPYGYVNPAANEFNLTQQTGNGWQSLTPSGYYVNPSDRDQDVMITPNQQLSQTSLYYGYTKDFQSVGAVTIHYVTGPNQTDVDTVSDHGITGQSFDIQPYLDDLPTDVSNNYVLASPSLYSDSGLSHQIQGSLTFGNTLNVYIRLNKVD